jgi:2-phospho-L-lactate guanylyltransferase
LVVESTWVVIVARSGPGAKSRLGSVLSPEQRACLALAMLADIAQTCVGSPGLAGVLGVVDLPVAARVLEAQGAVGLLEPVADGGLNAAIAAGLQAVGRRGATTAIVLPGDVPGVRAADLARLVQAAGTAARAVVVGPAQDGQGTNGLLLRPPDVIAPAFGAPSAARHLAAGQAARAVTGVCRDLGLALDIDTPADLAHWRAAHIPGCTSDLLRRWCAADLGQRRLS